MQLTAQEGFILQSKLYRLGLDYTHSKHRAEAMQGWREICFVIGREKYVFFKL